MKRKNLKLLRKILLLTFISIIAITNIVVDKDARAYEKRNIELSNETYTKEINLKQNIPFDGIDDSYKWYFDLDKNTSASSIKASLEYQIAEVARNSECGSYLTFSLNSVKFESVNLEKDSIGFQKIEFNLPDDLIREGSNELKIEGYLRVSDKPCIDEYNTANWLMLGAQSKLEVTTKNIISENNISQFPYPFINTGGYEETSIIIPDKYSDSELSAALQFEALLGKYNGEAEIIKFGDRVGLENKNIVFIGRVSEIPDEIKGVVGELNNESLTDNSLINISNSPFSDRADIKLLSIVSNNEKELTSSVKFLMNNKLVSQVQSGSTCVNSTMDFEEAYVIDEGSLTFKELGYGEMQFSGSNRIEKVIGYALPKNRVLSSGENININMRYSENLDFDRSLFTVYINGTPIGSKKLEAENANEDSLSLMITEDVANTSYVEIKLVFDLYMNDVNCQVEERENPWALVRGDSTIGLKSRNVSEYYFNTYPAPFISDFEANEVMYVLPNNLTSKELSAIGKTTAFMGRQIKYNNGEINAVSVDNLTKEDKEKNIILYGTPESNPFIKEINKDLWFKYNEDYTRFTSNEKLYLLDDYASKITTYQLDKSPFNNDKNILVLTSPNQEMLLESLTFLSDENNFSKLMGDGAVIDQFGNVKTFKYKEESTEPVYKKIEKLNTGSKVLLLMIILLAIFSLVAGGLYYYKNIRKNSRKNRGKRKDN